MSMSTLCSVMRNGSAALIIAGLLSMGSLAGAAGSTKPSPPPKTSSPKPSAPRTGSRPGGGFGGGASHGRTGGGGTSHGPTTGGAGSHGPTTGGASHGPTTGGATTHGPTTGGATTHGPTTGGATTHGPTTGGAGSHNTTTGGRSTATPLNNRQNIGGRTSAGASHSPIKGGSAPKGSMERTTRSGGAVRTRPGGHVSDVHDPKRGMDVHNNLGGGRRVSAERHDGSRMVSERGRRGYVERGYHYHGHDFGRRSYYYHGHEYNRFYRGYGYRGLSLNVYAPGFYFGPAFYGWAYNPWVAPISFGWGWAGNPWYGHFGYYFQPYPVYPSAAFWLTDYIISQDLQAAYAAHQEAGEADGAAPATEGGQPVLTPEVKQMIAEEVKNQLALENQEAAQNTANQDVDPGSSGIARLLSDGRPHVFVAGGNLDVTDASGQECVVSDGDTLQMQTAPPSDATTANLVVLSSKGKPECQISLTVQVQLTDLQEMQNHMRETIDQGLKDLQDKQGKDGLPAAPASAQAQPVPAQYAAVAPPPETNLAADLQQQDQQGVQAEKDVTTEASQDSGGATPDATAPAPATPDSPTSDAAPAAPPTSVDLGQTTDQVQAALGAPARVANLGPKVIYYYSGMKVVFKNGKVTEVQ